MRDATVLLVELVRMLSCRTTLRDFKIQDLAILAASEEQSKMVLGDHRSDSSVSRGTAHVRLRRDGGLR